MKEQSLCGIFVTMGLFPFALCRQATQIQLALRECLEVVPFSID